jgi:magnesium-transporting ATPase (P-type)
MVIACAWRDLEPTERIDREPDSGLVFAGLLACEDPVREGVAEAVVRCRELGIRVFMVTGDHPETARAVPAQKLTLVVSAALIPFAGFPLLYLPLHIVWLELIIHPTALLVFQGLPGTDRLLPVKSHDAARFFSAPSPRACSITWLATAGACAPPCARGSCGRSGPWPVRGG